MPRSSAPRLARRKPLSDVSNSRNLARVSIPHKEPQCSAEGDDAVFDRLLLTHAHLTKLVAEIDELVAHALEQGMTSKVWTADIGLFVDCLSNMCLDLKPWISKFKKALPNSSIKSNNKFGQSIVKVAAEIDGKCPPTDGLKDSTANLIVSSSPLVSWHTGTCTVERGKQLFLLTPLPKTKAVSSKLKTADSVHPVGSLTTTNVDVHDELAKTCAVVQSSNDSVLMVAEEDREVLERGAVSRPCPKSSLMSISLELNNGAFQEGQVSIDDNKVTHASHGDAVLNDPSCSDTSRPVESRNIEFKSINLFELDSPDIKRESPSCKITESLEWFMSPPVTCDPLDPPGYLNMMESTPMLNGLDSTVQRGRKGETTLKRELWMKFDAVSGPSLRPGVSVNRGRVNKGFLDMLEEVSRDMLDH